MKSEFEFLDSLRNHFNLSMTGDDCAVLPKSETKDFLATVDMLVEDIDFRLAWATPKQIGHKALAVSLSDIAAMGGRAQSSLVSLGISVELWNSGFLDGFYEGYMELADRFDVELAGGDISKIPGGVVIDSIVLGETEKDRAVLRSGAKPGDIIYTTGLLGEAKIGLSLLEHGERYGSSAFDEMLLRQLTPIPQLETGAELASTGIATSMIDLSDGLSSDLMHICNASGVGARLDAEKIPRPGPSSGLDLSETEILESAVNGGEDFQLLFTVDPKNNSSGLLDKFYVLGEITENTGNIELIDSGEMRVLEPGGYIHF